tara:strand:- start:1443 stop:2189 length:747 start_codon:yes stop_codon:yes gene_type:complete
MKSLDSIRDTVYFKFRQAQLEGMETDRVGKLHVSDLIKPCMRYVYYQKTNPRPSLSTEDMRPLFFGQAVHELTRLAEPKFHELTLAYDIVKDEPVDLKKFKMEEGHPRWYDIVIGTMDDVLKIDGDYVITDKKTTGSIDYFSRYNSKPSDSHVDQINTYRVLLKKCMNIDSTHGAIIYISSSINKEKNDKPVVMPFKLTEVEKTLEKMKKNQAIIKDAMLNDKVPERTKCFLCDGMCPAASFCFKDER